MTLIAAGGGMVIGGSRPLRAGARPDGLIRRDVWKDLEHGPLPHPWRDASTLPGQANREDRMAIGEGGLIQTTFAGDDYTTGPTVTTGWRSLAALHCGRSRVKAITRTDLSVTGTPHGGAAGVAFVNDAVRLGISNWLNLGFIEQGPIGLDALDFGYTFIEAGLFVGGEMCFIDISPIPSWILPPDGDESTQIIYCADDDDGVWWCWTAINGWVYAGPIRLPEALCGSLDHLVQIDVNAGGSSIDYSNLSSTEFWEFGGDVPPEYGPPVWNLAAAVATTAATATPVPTASLAVGDVAFMILASPVTIPVTGTGWTVEVSRSVSGQVSQVWSRRVNDGDTWHLGATVTISHPLGDVRAQMAGLTNANPYRPASLSAANDTGTDTAATVPAAAFAGPHRASLAWLTTAVAGSQVWGGIWAASVPVAGLGAGLVTEWPASALTDPGGAGHVPTTGTTAVTLGAGSRNSGFHIVAHPLVFRRDPDWPADIPTRDTGDTPWRV